MGRLAVNIAVFFCTAIACIGAGWLTWNLTASLAFASRLMWSAVAVAVMVVPLAFHLAWSERVDRGLTGAAGGVCRKCGYPGAFALAVGFCVACGEAPRAPR